MFYLKKQKNNILYGHHDRYWIPFNNPEIMSFYLNHLFVPHSRKELFKSSITRIIPFMSCKSMLHKTYLASNNDENKVTDIKAKLMYYESQLLEMMNLVGLTDLLEERLRQINFSFGGPFKLLVLEDYQHLSRSQKVFFLFDRASPVPCAVAKVNNNAKENSFLKSEYCALTSLQGQLGIKLNKMIPVPLVFFEDKELTVLIQTFLPGRSIYFDLRNSLFPKRHAQAHFRLALDWLIKFQLATKIKDLYIDEEFFKEHVIFQLEKYLECFDTSKHETEMIKNKISEEHKLIGERIPIVARQGDFWARNIIINGSYVGVVDWEQCLERSTPFYDLFMFPVSYGLSHPWRLARWENPVDAFRATFLHKKWLSQLVRIYFQSYCHSIGISNKLLEIFFFVFLIERALEEKNRIKNHKIKTDAITWRKLVSEYSQLGGSICF